MRVFQISEAKDSQIIKSASLCPIRLNNGNLEVLLTKRSFWNPIEQRPMSYAGEWIFPGGRYEDCDFDLKATAKREFREELGYAGQIEIIEMIRKATSSANGRGYEVEIYAASIDDSAPLVPFKNEVEEYAWMTPPDALTLMCSTEFGLQQRSEFLTRGFGNPKFGRYALTGRRFPTQNYLTLNALNNTELSNRLIKELNQPQQLKTA